MEGIALLWGSLAPEHPQLLMLLLRGILDTWVYGSSTETCFSFQVFQHATSQTLPHGHLAERVTAKAGTWQRTSATRTLPRALQPHTDPMTQTQFI